MTATIASLLSLKHDKQYTRKEKKALSKWYMSVCIYRSEADRDYLAYKAKIADLIKQRKDGDKLYVRVWSRDCDMCEGTSRHTIPASVMAYEQLCNYEYEYAEGPVSITIMTKEENEEYKPHFRDRALEAFEDGHPHIIYG